MHSQEKSQTSAEWWRSRRAHYNRGLLLAGILSFIAYLFVGEWLLPPEAEFEVTAFTLFGQGIGYLIMIGTANVLYNLGPLSEKWVKPAYPQRYRHICYQCGFWFSVLLPSAIPLALWIFN